MTMSKAKDRARRPFVVEMQPPSMVDGWYSIGVYRDQDEAEMQADLARKRVPEAKIRVRDLRVG
jgi:hypothetical protein